MPDNSIQIPGMHQPAIYHIRIKGHLGSERAEWCEGMVISRERNGDTLLTGPIVDQAALHGLLRKIRDLGMPLVSVLGDDGAGADMSDDERDRPDCQGTEGSA